MAVDPRIRFEDVAAAALAQAHVLLPEWMGGQRRGREWVAERKANGGLGDSWSVNLDTGRWGAYASGERGGDLVSLYAAIHHIENIAALPIVASLVGLNGSGVPVLGVTRFAAPAPTHEPERPLELIPPDPGPVPGEAPTAIYQRYGNEFIIARYDPEGKGKTYRPWHWHRGQWKAGHGRRPYRLYNLEELASRPNGTVLIVEGEKTAEALIPILPTYIVMTWSHGASSIHKSDWTPLRGRHVLIWPDADLPGVKAGNKIKELLEGIAASVRAIRPPADAGHGWDLADGTAEGWTAERIEAHISETPLDPDPKAPKSAPYGELITADERVDDENYPAGQPPRSALISWQGLGLATNDKDVPHATLANVSMILRFEAAFKGNIWWDSFCERIYHTMRGGAPQEWTDVESKRATAYIQQQLQLPKVHLKMVDEAVQHAAHEVQRNSVREWLEALEWDGIERLGTWVGDCLGVELNAYTMAVSRNWIISMVARAYRPGCQVDTMPVLEGLQGEGKSSALEILGDRWYSSVGTAFGSYDFINTIQGRWLIEIPDMAGFSRREHSHVIATITTRTDRYRVKYGHFDEDHPRKCVFAATSETDDYLPEMRGYRRYWPLRCREINLSALRHQRERIFAEALHAYRAGASYHQMPKQATSDEQRSRTTDDLWTEDVLGYCAQRAMAGHPVSPTKILTDSAIEMPRKQLDHASKLRVTNILKAHGWIPKLIDNQRMWIKPRQPDLGD